MKASNKAGMRDKRFHGFTLVELIVVITILAILATIGFLALSGYSQDAKDSAIKANVRSIQTIIASESAITGNSPRYYVVHDSDYALTGVLVYVDGVGIPLTWGTWNDPVANYSAGLPDYVKLKLNPEKFKISTSAFPLAEVFAANDGKSVSVGAISVSAASSNGKARSVSYFQVTGVTPAGAAVVTGNYPTSSGSVAGLVKSPGSAIPLRDGTSVWSVPPSVTPAWAGIVGDDAAGRKWTDGTYAVSCSGYLNPPAGKAYAGSTGNGTYWIDPNGGANTDGFKAYCDMTSDGGGWTFGIGDTAAITAGKYSTIYGDGTYPVMACTSVASSTQVVMHSGVFASNCNPYNMTAADLTCVNTNIGLWTANILRWAYYGNFSNTCVSVGDRCPSTGKSHTIAWRCR